VKRKALTADTLRVEIPMAAPGRMEAILEGYADANEQAVFVECLAERYAAPSMHTVRQRLLLARAVQDGYPLAQVSLPERGSAMYRSAAKKSCYDFAIYKLVYNLTVDAWRHCSEQGEAAENAWFEEHLPEWDRNGLFLHPTFSLETANVELARWLTRCF
jgi:hypothetical protein